MALSGIRLPTGLPERAGLRPADVVVDVVDGPLLSAGPIAVGSDPAWGNGLFASVDKSGTDAPLQGRSGPGTRRWPLIAGLSSIEGMQIERVEDPPLTPGAGDAPRLLHGHVVVGPRRVEASNDGTVIGTWDIVHTAGAPLAAGPWQHRRLIVKDGGNKVDVEVVVLPPQGVCIQDLLPAGCEEAGDDDNLPGSTFGLTSAAVARRIALDVTDHWPGAWIGWDGVVRPGPSPAKSSRHDATWLFTVLSEGEVPRKDNRREHARAAEATEPASTEELASLVLSLRPTFVQQQQKYRDDMTALAARVAR